MAKLDPRRQPLRLTPMVFASAAALTIGMLVWRVFQPVDTGLPIMDPGSIMALETRAYAAAAQRPGYSQSINVPILVRSGETLSAAVIRAGVPAAEAMAAVNILSQAFDVVNIRSGLDLKAAIAKPVEGMSLPTQLLGLTLRTGPAKQVTLTTSQDGSMRLRTLEESVRDERRVAIGTIDGSLFSSAAALGANHTITTEVVKLFAHKLDFTRDIQNGDRFKLVFDRKVTESGRVVATGNLLYAEIEAKNGVSRFYNFQKNGGKISEYFDETGKNIKGFLLATPVDGARTSSGFGMRLHPLLGFMKMHTGIDFAASSGTPIYAAGDGIISDAKWWGGYGRWVRISHNKEWDTGYAHMSAIAVRPGQRVSQGQLIGYVGSTGRSTGAHLHFEIWRNGHPINPKDARVPQGTILAGSELAAFKARKREIDTMIVQADLKQAGDDQPQTLAMRYTPYKFESGNASSSAGPVATKLVSNEPKPLGYASLRPALSSTRGSR
jgi:murein DD-endopeptidase MepM/ murein hydrolase activator NlpD